MEEGKGRGGAVVLEVGSWTWAHNYYVESQQQWHLSHLLFGKQ